MPCRPFAGTVIAPFPVSIREGSFPLKTVLTILVAALACAGVLLLWPAPAEPLQESGETGAPGIAQ